MSDSERNQLREKNWRRKLTPDETAELQAWLDTQPEARADWEAEARLTEAMSRLPEVPVPSNFTARVLQAVERESAAEKRTRPPARKWSLRSLLPRAAAVAVILGTGLFTYHEYTMTQRNERVQLAQGVKIVSEVPSLPGPEILQDFDTIRQLPSGRPSGPDQDLLKLNQDLLALEK